MKEPQDLIDTPERLRSLSLAQIEALRKRSPKRRARAVTPVLSAQRRLGPVPLSCAQEGLWFLDQLGLVGAAYNVPIVIELEGTLDIAVLEHSLTELLRRHEILRTRFLALEGEPCQVIDPPRPVRLEVRDLSALAGQAEQLSDTLLRTEAQRPFNLSEGAVRLGLLRHGEHRHLLSLVMHHIVADGWSSGVLLRELSTLYEAFTAGQPSPLPELSVQYADYALWQRQCLEGSLAQEHIDYWKKQLAGAPSELNLPTDRPRPSRESFKGASLRFELPAAPLAAAKALAHQHGATLFMVALAAYQIVLARWSGQEDIVVGSPIAGRASPDLEGLLGCFVNTLALRTQVSAGLSFRELLVRARDVALEAYAHQALPFDLLVKELRPERSLARQPIFQVMLALQNFPEERLRRSGLTWACTTLESNTTHFDLTLYLQESPQGLSCSFQYATDLFDESTIGRMATHLRTLLQAALADPDRDVYELAWLSEGEWRQVVVDWNATGTAYPHDRLLHELFEAQVSRTPEAIALADESSELSYAALNARANQLARYLRALGVGPDRLVALYLARSVDTVVAMLAVLKAGGAYVPLDPSNPSERLRHTLADANAQVVLTHTGCKSGLPPVRATVLALDEEWHRIEPLARDDLGRGSLPLGPENLAYVIYTSGSTGQPKGVAVEHRNIVNYACYAQQRFEIAQGEGSLICTSMSFDLMLTGLYPTLLSGRTVRLCPEEAGLPSLTQQILRCRKVAPLKLTPSHLALLEPLLLRGELAQRVSVLVLGGEPLHASMLRAWRAHSPQTRIFNHYGPTETTVGCIVNPVLEEVSGTIALGRPIANSRIYILDARRAPTPIGVVGEIYIAGAGVARGYLNRPELTQQRFLPDPFVAGERMYKSGDLGRWRANGTIEYLGRADQQVKVRGYRVELGEIEAQLIQHEHVKEAVVVQRDVEGEKRLVAYLTSSAGVVGGDEPSVERLRQHLKARLPEYMIPLDWVILEQLPLTANGKVNRSALPEPQRCIDPSREYVEPHTQSEVTVARIWKQLLRIERVGRYDDFFALGGHSLLAMQAIAQVLASVAIELPIRSIFESPTLHEFSQRLDEAREAALLQRIEAGDADVDELLAEVASLPEARVNELLQKFAREG